MDTTLRQIGNSLGLVIPKAVRDSLGLAAGQRVSIEEVPEGLLIRSRPRRYRLEELIAMTEPDAGLPDDVRPWLDAPARGREVW